MRFIFAQPKSRIDFFLGSKSIEYIISLYITIYLFNNNKCHVYRGRDKHTKKHMDMDLPYINKISLEKQI